MGVWLSAEVLVTSHTMSELSLLDFSNPSASCRYYNCRYYNCMLVSTEFGYILTIRRKFAILKIGTCILCVFFGQTLNFATLGFADHMCYVYTSPTPHKAAVYSPGEHPEAFV